MRREIRRRASVGSSTCGRNRLYEEHSTWLVMGSAATGKRQTDRHLDALANDDGVCSKGSFRGSGRQPMLAQGGWIMAGSGLVDFLFLGAGIG